MYKQWLWSGAADISGVWNFLKRLALCKEGSFGMRGRMGAPFRKGSDTGSVVVVPPHNQWPYMRTTLGTTLLDIGNILLLLPQTLSVFNHVVLAIFNCSDRMITLWTPFVFKFKIILQKLFLFTPETKIYTLVSSHFLIVLAKSVYINFCLVLLNIV
jgi:hypothetical protein